MLYQLSYSRMSLVYGTINYSLFMERETRLELATLTMARLCSTN